MTGEEEFLQKLRESFRVEAREHIRNILSALKAADSEKDSEARTKRKEALFREIHSLKGASRAVDLSEVELICQALESALYAEQGEGDWFSPETVGVLRASLDLLSDLAEFPSEPGDVAGLLKKLQNLQGKKDAGVGGEIPLHEREEKKRPRAENPRDKAETVRVPVATLYSLTLKSEEFLSLKSALLRYEETAESLSEKTDLWRRQWGKLRPSSDRLKADIKHHAGNGNGTASLNKLLDFVEKGKEIAASLDHSLKELSARINRDRLAFETLLNVFTTGLRDSLMLPAATAIEGLPRMIKEIARQQKKKVLWEVKGDGIEIDRRILDEIKDPLIHLVRNSIDHGIEKPEERQRMGKPPEAGITLSIIPLENDRVEITLSDDGRGVDVEKVRESALKSGLIDDTRDGAMTDTQKLELIFLSRVSTSPIITDLSGRGLGLSIVREKAENLGGAVLVSSEPGKGTSVRMILPMALSAFRGLAVRAAEQVFVIPSRNVVRVLRADRRMIRTVENRRTIVFYGVVIPVFELAAVLGLTTVQAREKSLFCSAVVVSHSGAAVCFLVDLVLQEQEILAKGLGKQLRHVRYVSGVTLTADGMLIPILRISECIEAAVKNSGILPDVLPAMEVPEQGRKKILVAEDSITSRLLLKNILESAGYEVTTKVDGLEAFNSLKAGGFDLVVTDVDMPRMNGFALTEKIRHDDQLKSVPVVLVTSLDSREDLERGVESGADAYIVKSGFDQINLLEIIKRLL